MKKISIGVIIMPLLICCSFPSPAPTLSSSGFAQLTTLEAKDYGPEYFAPIEGEISGQTAPGVQQVKVNGQTIKVNPNLTFAANVVLAAGEQYLTIETLYKNLRFTKKYLVIRHPKAEKTFKIVIPQSEFPAYPAKPKPKKQLVIINEQKAPPPKEIVMPDEEIVITAEPNLRPGLLARTKNWLRDKPERRANAPVKTETPKIEDLVQQQGPAILKEEIEKIVSRDVPAGAGLKVARAEIIKMIGEEAPKIIQEQSRMILDKKLLANEAVVAAALKIIDEEALRKLAEETVKSEARHILDRERLREIAETSLRQATVEAQLKGIKIHQLGGKQPFDLILELQPNKMLLVREDNGRYIASILDTQTKVWVQLDEISADELKQLLENKL